MEANAKDFWVIGLFFLLIGGFVGYLIGVSPSGGITGFAVKDDLPKCFDSDGGTAISGYGYAVTAKERYFDNCEDSLTLNEATCGADNQIYIKKITCNYGCFNGVCNLQ